MSTSNEVNIMNLEKTYFQLKEVEKKLERTEQRKKLLNIARNVVNQVIQANKFDYDEQYQSSKQRKLESGHQRYPVNKRDQDEEYSPDNYRMRKYEHYDQNQNEDNGVDEEMQDGQDQDQYTGRSFINSYGRTLFTDAYKNYIVRLCDKFSLKSISEATKILYTNIVRWRIQVKSGKVPYDNRYKPTQQDLQEQKRMQQIDEFSGSKYHSNQYQEDEEQHVPKQGSKMDIENEKHVYTRQQQKQSPDYQKEYDEYRSNSRNARPNYGEDRADSQEKSRNESKERRNYSDEAQERPQPKQTQSKVLPPPSVTFSFVNQPWYIQYEDLLVDQIHDLQLPPTQSKLISMAKTLRDKLSINQPFSISKDWYEYFISHREITIQA